eukprot:2004974-Prorocentrum_lima.AAC.1
MFPPQDHPRASFSSGAWVPPALQGKSLSRGSPTLMTPANKWPGMKQSGKMQNYWHIRCSVHL